MKWQSIFEQSRIYGGHYNGDKLPQLFNMPVKNSWFQTRLKQVRQQQRNELSEQSRKQPERSK